MEHPPCMNVSPERKLGACRIAIRMAETGLDLDFVTKALGLALMYEGFCDLMEMWAEEGVAERPKTIEAIKEVIDDHDRIPD